MTDNGTYQELPKRSADCMDLTLIARTLRHNSERWFPALHARDDETVRIHYVLGLIGEAGEVADQFKKVHTGKRTLADALPEIGAELADLFTYLLLIADSCGLDVIADLEAKHRVCEERWGNDR